MEGVGTWDMGVGTWDFGPGTWDTGLGTGEFWSFGVVET